MLLNELVEFAVAASLDFASPGVSIVSLMVHGWCCESEQYSPASSVVTLRLAVR
jgi:hypothetical protein